MTLGPGGVKTDIVTGLPHQRQRLTKEAIENQIQQATNISVKLELDLQGEGGTVLETLVETIAAHAEQVLSKDPVYQLYMKFVESL